MQDNSTCWIFCISMTCIHQAVHAVTSCSKAEHIFVEDARQARLYPYEIPYKIAWQTFALS